MNNSARDAILGSIRSHLATSAPYDNPANFENPVILSNKKLDLSPVELFKRNLESVNGHCILTTDVTDALRQIITDLKGRRIAISDDPNVERWLRLTDLEIEELGIAPNAQDIFRFDIGISTAQAAIAETGTLVLDSAHERHRFVSLVPPVHIAIVDASRIVETLGDALALLRSKNEISPAVTFITGPSRTADIELTLAIGVHGPQELYVIIKEVVGETG
ncbi:MAG TPA: lactate utilization protein [Pyrinomonadaceae bacterium]|nr:lactate utilization protein [Pyrinomonadaceae bacterium]